jgi:hypothetical protein
LKKCWGIFVNEHFNPNPKPLPHRENHYLN